MVPCHPCSGGLNSERSDVAGIATNVWPYYATKGKGNCLKGTSAVSGI